MAKMRVYTYIKEGERIFKYIKRENIFLSFFIAFVVSIEKNKKNYAILLTKKQKIKEKNKDIDVFDFNQNNIWIQINKIMMVMLAWIKFHYMCECVCVYAYIYTHIYIEPGRNMSAYIYICKHILYKYIDGIIELFQ